MLAFLYLQRWRLGFGALFMLFSAILMLGTNNGWGSGSAILSTAFVFTVGATAIAAAVIYILPAYRQVWETLAVTLFVLRAAEAMGPSSLSEYLDGPGGMVLTAVLYLLIFNGVYGAWWERLSFGLPYTCRSRTRAIVLPEAAWAAIVPHEAAPQRHYSGTLAAFERVEGDHFRQKQKVGKGQFSETDVVVLRDEPPHFFAYGSADPETGERVDGFYWQASFSPAPMGSTDIEVIERNQSLPVNHAVLCMLDDLGGQVAHSMKTFLETRKDPTLLGWLRRRVAATG